MTYTLEVLKLLMGLALLLGGGELLVRGASDLAKSLGISSLVIGLTVVAFGTSTPELAVNLTASYRGHTEISFGNIIGSNIANVGLILGCAALIRPLNISSTIISREIPMMVLASVLVIVLAHDRLLTHGVDGFERSDGLVLLILFCVFMYYTIAEVFRNRGHDPLVAQAESSAPRRPDMGKTLFSLLLTMVGFVLLISGGKLAVSSASFIAEAMGIPQVIIALSIVAVGTSLPELVTSIIATWKGKTDLAVGNVVGSNIFNLLFINGISASLRPISVPQPGGFFDVYVMTALGLLLLLLSITHKKRIVRWEGGVLLSLYLCYQCVRFFVE